MKMFISTVLGAVIISLLLSACDGSSISGIRSESRALVSGGEERLRSGDIPFRLDEAVFSVNGNRVASRVTVSDASFNFLFFYLKNDGLFIVSHKPFDVAVQSGSFGGRILSFSRNGFTIEIENENELLLGDRLVRPAWVQHLPAFVMFESPDRSPDSVIGLVDFFWQIPWFDTN